MTPKRFYTEEQLLTQRDQLQAALRTAVRQRDKAEAAMLEMIEVAKRADAEIERLHVALKPFAMFARGEYLNPSPDEWQRASAVYQNTGADT